MTEDKALVERLRAWEPLVSTGYEVPAAGRAIYEAADRIEVLTAEKDKLGNLLLETADRNAREIVRLEVENERLRALLVELADLMDDVCEGHYKPDSFTTQPARAALGDTQ